MSHVREARMLCRKTVDLFTLLSHTGDAGATRRMGMTQELLSLVTGLAHYLKILIRIALTGALKLDRDHGRHAALLDFLDKLQGLAVEGGNPAARRVVHSARAREIDPSNSSPNLPLATQGVSYGYSSLAPENAGESPFIGRTTGPNAMNGTMVTPPSDLCLVCQKTVEEDCVRLGTYNRWHSQCVRCVTCGRMAMDPVVKDKDPNVRNGDEQQQVDKPISTTRRPPANVHEFLYQPDPASEHSSHPLPPRAICCVDHPIPGSRAGFSAVSRLEQYAFLLNVALRRLYLLLLRRGLMPPAASLSRPDLSSPGPSSHTAGSAYRGGQDDILRMKSVHLDRKLSATARLPKRSTVVESPSGRIAQPTDVMTSMRGASHHPASINGSSGNLRSGEKKAPRPVAPPSLLPESDSPENHKTLRPAFARNNTNIQIIDELPPEAESSDDYRSPITPIRDTAVLSDEGFMEGDEGLTLGDIPQLLESEQAREQHRSLPRQGAKPAVAELTPLELLIVRHFAVLALQRSALRDQFDLDEILELLETKKSTFWNKLFKRNDDKSIKKKGQLFWFITPDLALTLLNWVGVFGIPLEFLVEREGADSLLGASRGTLRIPSFVDDVISAMKQMGMSYLAQSSEETMAELDAIRYVR